MPNHFHGYYGPALANIQLVIPDTTLMLLLSVDALKAVFLNYFMSTRTYSMCLRV